MPTDLCIWKWGESERRDVTKIGGIPYWPAHEPWPLTHDTDEPITFVAQFCFTDSKDILPRLPGDILSVLVDRWGWGSPQFRWFKLGARLKNPSRLPASQWKIAPCHAVLHRTADYPESNWDEFQSYPYPLGGNARCFRDHTKIGGHWDLRGEIPDPDWYEEPEMREYFRKAHEQVKLKAREFLCQLHAVSFSSRWPFVNVPDFDILPLGDVKNKLQIADCGGIDIFFDGTSIDSDAHSG